METTILLNLSRDRVTPFRNGKCWTILAEVEDKSYTLNAKLPSERLARAVCVDVIVSRQISLQEWFEVRNEEK